ncbi:MAG: C25 family cysteine peptidase [candidate division WOR-3 bacterium]
MMVPFYFTLQNPTFKDVGFYVYPVVEGGVYNYIAGEPFLPYLVLEINTGFPVRSVELTVLDVDTFLLNKPLYPSQGFLYADGREIPYDEFKPKYRGEYGGFGVISWRYSKGRVFVVISAFKYISEGNILLFSRGIKLEVEPLIGVKSKDEGNYNSQEHYDMLLIYPDNFSGGSVERFINFKKKQAIRVIAKKVQEANDFRGRDLAERIREMIKYYHSQFGVKWVLLVGDNDVIPVRYAKLYSYFQYGNEIPTDLYYADLDGDWDLNGNGVFGEVSDSLDLFADVYVGRIPINDEYVFDRYIDMLEEYLNFSPRYLKVFALGYDLFSGGSNEGMDAVNYMLQNLPPTMTLDTLSRMDLSSFIDSLNTHFFTTVVVHGNFQHFLLGGGYYTIGSATSQNINKPVFLNIIDCNNGALDKPSLVKFIFNNSNSGIIGIRATSRLNAPTFSSTVDKAFIDSVFSGKSLGEAFYKSLAYFIPLAISDNIYRYLTFGYVLYGDPSLYLWHSNPSTLSFSSTLPGSTYGTLYVNCDSGCRVLVDGITSYVSDGSTKSITTNFPNNLKIYAYKPNYYPAETSAVLTGYKLKFYLNKSVLSVGDTAELTLYIENNGNAPFNDTVEISFLKDTVFMAYIPPKGKINIRFDVFSPFEGDTFLVINSETLRVNFINNSPLVFLSPFGTWITNPHNVQTDTFFINGNPYILREKSYYVVSADTVFFYYKSYADTILPTPVDTPVVSFTPIQNGIRITSSDTFMVFHTYDRKTLRPLTLKPITGMFEINNISGFLGISRVRRFNLSNPVWIEVRGFPRKVWEITLKGAGQTSPIFINGYIYATANSKIYKLNLNGVILDSADLTGDVWDNISYGDGLLGIVSSNGKFGIYDTSLNALKVFDITVIPTQTQVAYFNGKFYINSGNNLLRCDTTKCDTLFSDTSLITSFSIRQNGEIFLTTFKNLYRIYNDSIYALKTFYNQTRQVVSTNSKVFVLLNAYLYTYPDDTTIYIGETDGYMSLTPRGEAVISLLNRGYMSGNYTNQYWTLAFYNEPLSAFINGKETYIFAPGDGGFFAFDSLGNIIPLSPFGNNVLTGRSYELFENGGKVYLLLANSWNITLYELGEGTISGYWYYSGGDLSRRNYLNVGTISVSEITDSKGCVFIERDKVVMECEGVIYDVLGRKVFKGKGVFSKRGAFFVKVKDRVLKVVLKL